MLIRKMLTAVLHYHQAVEMQRITLVFVTTILLALSPVATSAAGAPGDVTSLLSDLGSMSKSTFRFWQQYGIDGRYGGFHGTLNFAGSLVDPTSKTLVQTARHAWAFSFYHKYGPQAAGSPSPAAMAGTAYGFMRKHMLDPGTHLFYYSVSRDGRTILNPNKVLYALWFGIYGAAAYGRTFGDSAAVDAAMACFQVIDETWHNTTTGGYNELLSNNIPGGGRPYNPATTPDRLTPPTLNAILHGIEALTELYKSRPDDLVKKRLLELLNILCIKMITTDGIIYSDYTPSLDTQRWQPTARSVVNYGHLIETSWLVCNTLDVLLAAKAINPMVEAVYRQNMVTLGARTVTLGYDNQHGGFYDYGLPGEAPQSDKKIWWSQAEGALGLWNLYVHTKDLKYLQMLVQTVGFMKEYLRDSRYGEFLWQVEANGSSLSNYKPGPGMKGNAWKASYHILRMLVLLPRRIRAGS